MDIARRHADDRHPYIVGFNLAGDEAGYPPAQFKRGLRDRGRRPASAAPSTRASTPGRIGPRGAHAPRSRRLSHGVRAVEDPALVEEIAERGIVLEVCPTSQRRHLRLRRLRAPPTPQTP